MKKLFIIWGSAVLFIIFSSPFVISAAARQPEVKSNKTAMAKKTVPKTVKQPAKKIGTPHLLAKKAPAPKKAPFKGTKVIYIYPKAPWYWNPLALFLICAGVFIAGLIAGGFWKMGSPIPRPPREISSEPEGSWLRRFFGKFRSKEVLNLPG
ncbi:MAG: hypothetical protein WC831_00505 [Parcubacteria group bacterium]